MFCLYPTDKKVNNSKITTVESAVNWGYEYTEIVVEKYEITDEQGNKIDEISGHFFIKTSNIVKTQKDMTSLIPIAAAVVAVIALLIALMALFKIKKQNKELTAQIKAICFLTFKHKDYSSVFSSASLSVFSSET